MKKLTILTGLLLSFQLIFAQQKDVLIKIDDHKVMAQEFMRVYQKNNSDNTMDPRSIDNYLDLYIDFKLKVLEAEALGYDTVPSFKKELAEYRDKLAKPYFESEEAREEIIQEAYDRMVEEVEVSHIMLQVPSQTSLDDTLDIYNKALEISKKIKNGDLSFEQAALRYSDDATTAQDGGYLGYLSAFSTVYPFETAAYNTPADEISDPVRTQYGYHIIKTHGKRKSPGEVRAAHIFKRVNRDAPDSEWEQAKKEIDSLYQLLEKGEPFDKLAMENSDDSHSARRGGDVGWFKAGKMVPTFAEAAIDLEEEGTYTQPVRTNFGYHIIQLIDKKPVGSFDEVKKDLIRQVKSDARNQVTKKTVVNNLKKENNFDEYPENLKHFLSAAEGKVKSRQFDSINLSGNMVLFDIEDKQYTQEQFLDYLKTTYRSRNRNNELAFITNAYNSFVEQELMNYEEARLEEKYPEFRHLFQEDHDGCWLFNIMNDKVWNFAAKDSVGLELFYQQNKDNYLWDERADVSEYTFLDEDMAEELKQAAVKRAHDDLTKEALIAQFCDTTQSVACINVSDKKVERGRDEVIDQMEWEAGNVSDIQKTDEAYLFKVINGVIDPAHKKLNEAKGLVISDYQEYLEDKWLYDLHQKYDIQVNTKILKKVKRGKYN